MRQGSLAHRPASYPGGVQPDPDLRVPFPERNIPIGTLVKRGLTRRCGRCGSGDLFDGWFAMKPECPTCGITFEREHGYWLGAMTIDMAVAEGVFVVVLAVALAITYPDVPWGWLFVVLVGANLIIPVFFYPVAKTLWVALERGIRSRMEAAG